MSASAVNVYLVAGATRGIGIPARSFYAGARDPVSASTSELGKLAKTYPGRIEIVKYFAGDEAGNKALAKEIGAKYGRIDTVIANAGISNSLGKIHETSISKFEDHFAVNVNGPIVLFQAVRDLLKASAHPRFIPIGSIVGSLALIGAGTMDVAPYGASKVALHWVTRKIRGKYTSRTSGLVLDPTDKTYSSKVSFPICPGMVDTDMSKAALASDPTGQLAELTKRMWATPSAAANGLVDVISASTRETDGGQFHNLEGTRHPW